MYDIKDFSDERQKSWCIYCGAGIGTNKTNKDHIPTKSLLAEPLPKNLPVVRVCSDCNAGFSKDEEYLTAFLSCVISGSTEPKAQRIPSAFGILKHSPKLRSQLEQSKTVSRDRFAEEDITWRADKARIERVVCKNARGHAFFEMGEPMLGPPSNIGFAPLHLLSPSQRDSFFSGYSIDVWPEVGSRLMTRLATGQDMVDGWVVVQEGVYRYVVEQLPAMRVKMILWEYLAVEVVWDT